MATKSSNVQGNPYHDDDGKFTSADNIGSGKAAQQQAEKQQMQTSMPDSPSVAPVPSASQAGMETPKTSSKFLKFKLKSNIEDIRHNLTVSRQVSSIPFLTSAYDVEEHIEEYFSDEIVENINSKFGKFSVPYKYFNLRTDPHQRCGVNIFAACIGKKRWANNYLRLVDSQEYNKLCNSWGFQKLNRGIQAPNYSTYRLIADSYSSKENEMIYGSSGGTCYGIAVYTSSRWSDARSYAAGNENHIMDLVLNKNTRTMPYRTICQIRNDLSYRKGQILPKVEKIFLDHGIEPGRAHQMAQSFGITLDDEGFVAMLCGVEWYQDGNYHMVENLGSMYRVLR